MKEILLLNPRKRTKKRTTRRKASTKKRTTRRRTTRRTTATRRTVARKGIRTMAAKKRRAVKRKAPRRNPTSRRRRRSPSRSSGGTFQGLNIKTALRGIPLNTLGMFAAKWAAKRFGQAASETDPASWNYASYLKGAAGAAMAGVIANMLKRGSGQKILEGGMSLMLYKLVQNELVPGSEFWSGQLGATERVPGTVEYNSAGEPFLLGEDYEWYPMEGADDYRMLPDAGDMSGALIEPGPLGDALTEPGPLGFGADIDDTYRAAFLNR